MKLHGLPAARARARRAAALAPIVALTLGSAAATGLAREAGPAREAGAAREAEAGMARATTATASAAPTVRAASAVAVARSGMMETSIAHLPGLLLAVAAARDPAGRDGLALLVAGEAGGQAAPAATATDDAAAAADPAPGRPRTLYFFTPGSPELTRLAGDLPAAADSVAALIVADAGGSSGGDGGARGPGTAEGRGDRLLIGEPGVLYALDRPWEGAAAARCHQLLAAPGLDLRSLHLSRDNGDRPPRARLPWVPVAQAGRLDLLAPVDPAAVRLELQVAATWKLPESVSREPWGIKITSPQVRLLPAPPAATLPRFALGPEPEGRLRLRSLLLPASAAEAPIEAWSLRPTAGTEIPGETRFDFWDGRPVLVVATTPKLGIFVKRELLLFPLARDRSRGGGPPSLSAATECPIWHGLSVDFAALDGNGRQDLVLICPEGLRAKKLHFDVWTDLGDGRLSLQPSTSTVDVEADAWFYGADFSGDGVPDLLVKSGRRLLLYPGVARSHRLADRPVWSFDLPLPPAPPGRSGKPADEPPAGNGNGDGDDERDAAATAAAAGTAPPWGRLAATVDLGGDGRPTFLFTVADARGRTQLVAVQPVRR